MGTLARQLPTTPDLPRLRMARLRGPLGLRTPQERRSTPIREPLQARSLAGSSQPLATPTSCALQCCALLVGCLTRPTRCSEVGLDDHIPKPCSPPEPGR